MYNEAAVLPKIAAVLHKKKYTKKISNNLTKKEVSKESKQQSYPKKKLASFIPNKR